MGDFQRSDPGKQQETFPSKVGLFGVLIQLFVVTVCFRQRAAFDKDELIGCL
jgi:hypothetical protein